MASRASANRDDARAAWHERFESLSAVSNPVLPVAKVLGDGFDQLDFESTEWLPGVHWESACFRPNGFVARATGWSADDCGTRLRPDRLIGVDLTFSSQAEDFRAELRTWLSENIPPGFGTKDFPDFTSLDEEFEFLRTWQSKLAAAP